jgi:DNA/RNA endonuclease YhcR with UshA esterase domain
MREKTLLQIAIVISILGLVFLYYVSENTLIGEKIIESIDSTDFEKDIRIKGTVEKVIDKDKILILEVSQPKTITVIAFKDGAIDIKEGELVQIFGSVQEYEGKPEIIADEIKVE